jgi:hypothetical protein
LPPGAYLSIDIARQLLTICTATGEALASYTVSTALNGPGEQDGSGCTPRGEHYIRARIGAGQPLNTVFRGRRPTGEVYSPQLAAAHPDRDWILTRILWLCGREWGRNRGPGVDTFRRFIYIHGTPDTEPMGVAKSHGCVRMRNRDIAELFDRVPAGMRVMIF